MRSISRFVLALCLLTPAISGSPAVAVDLSNYLPDGVEYDPGVPTPAQVLGFEVGEQHVRPDQIVTYFSLLARSSSRVRLEIQGSTYERRPLILLTITSSTNQLRLDEIRKAQLAVGDPAQPALADAELESLPAVVWLGYSIHGNEASGSNAALLTAYHLAAAKGPEIEALLRDVVVLIDPSLNPDGLGRFTEWVTMHRSEVPVSDPEHRELREPWPGGRTNHYWFDLNRDWMPLQHPESQARIETFYRWRPNLLGDYHEMGSHSTFFFQPGVESRTNPWIPARNRELSSVLAGYHAAALDEAGVLFYTGETFDDFYAGKGSTYPDLTGSIGILFEQASSRGRLRQTRRGLLDFPSTIHHQFLTSLSMLEGAQAMRLDLHRYRRDFARQALDEARGQGSAAYVFATPGDPVRAFHLLELLRRHRIEVRPLVRDLDIGGQRFVAGEAWAVPLDQPAYRLVQAIFDRRTDFDDSAFYDISSWSLLLAFDTRWTEVDRGVLAASGGAAVFGEPLGEVSFPAQVFAPVDGAYAYAFPWSGHYAPRALYRLLDAGVTAQVATVPFTAAVAGASAARQSFDEGTVVVPLGESQPIARGMIEDLLATAAREDGVAATALASGLTPDGVDLGSPSIVPLRRPRPLLVVGEGVDAGEAGELWFLLDQRMAMPLSLVDKDRLAGLDLSKYTHVLMVDGRYGDLGDSTHESLDRWLRRGGVLVTQAGAARWAGETFLQGRLEAPAVDLVEHAEPPGTGERSSYADYEAEQRAKTISGAIFEAEIDRTHPMAFGLPDAALPIFHAGTEPLRASTNPWENVATYTAEPLLAGYAPEEARAALAHTAALTATRVDDGLVVRLADDPAYRAFWFGTQKLVLNPLFFSAAVRPTPEEWRR